MNQPTRTVDEPKKRRIVLIQRLSAAAVLGLLGLAILSISLFVEPPFTSTVNGPVLDFVHACDTCDYSLDVGQEGAYTSFMLIAPIKPDVPQLLVGQSVGVTYQDLYRGQVVLSVTTAPGTSSSVTYTTLDYDRYQKNFALAWLAMAGILLGGIATAIGVAWFAVAARRRGFARGATSAALAPLTLLGGLAFVEVGLTAYVPAVILIWLIAAIAATVLGRSSFSLKESPRGYATFGITTSVTVSAVWVIVLVAGVIHAASSF
jgi:hypothetical protein